MQMTWTRSHARDGTAGSFWDGQFLRCHQAKSTFLKIQPVFFFHKTVCCRDENKTIVLFENKSLVEVFCQDVGNKVTLVVFCTRFCHGQTAIGTQPTELNNGTVFQTVEELPEHGKKWGWIIYLCLGATWQQLKLTVRSWDVTHYTSQKVGGL